MESVSNPLTPVISVLCQNDLVITNWASLLRQKHNGVELHFWPYQIRWCCFLGCCVTVSEIFQILQSDNLFWPLHSHTALTSKNTGEWKSSLPALLVTCSLPLLCVHVDHEYYWTEVLHILLCIYQCSYAFILNQSHVCQIKFHHSRNCISCSGYCTYFLLDKLLFLFFSFAMHLHA